MIGVIWSSSENCWVSSYFITFNLKNRIDDVQLYTKALYRFFLKERLPFPYQEIRFFFRERTIETGRDPYWKEGFVVLKVKEPSLLSKLNPFHDELRGDETIVIHFLHGTRHFKAWQEITSDFRIRWKLNEEEILKFLELLEKFAKKDEIELTMLVTKECRET